LGHWPVLLSILATHLRPSVPRIRLLVLVNGDNSSGNRVHEVRRRELVVRCAAAGISLYPFRDLGQESPKETATCREGRRSGEFTRNARGGYCE
jgi:hypothetical protein